MSTKKALFNLVIGPPRKAWKACLQSQHDYCEKHNIDHIISTEMKVHWPYGPNPICNFFFEKLQMWPLLQKYDQVLYLDADVLITPTARNIFEKYNRTDTYYGYDESQLIGVEGKTMFGTTADVMDRDPYVKSVLCLL